MAFYSSFGGAGEVTGSCHLLEIGHIKILIDCGMFQGKEEELNFAEFGFNPKTINYLILTHAHLDHIGRVPLLVKKGFKGSIICTKATFDIAKLMLKNSAGILQEKPNPLYRIEDIEPSLELFGEFLEYNQELNLQENIKISFKNAGHILGSATLKIKYEEDGMKKSAVFSGDIGQQGRIITSPIDFWHEANYIFIESTYGDRIHPNLELSIKKFKSQIIETIKNNAVVVLPSFALERTQEILYLLRQLSLEKKLKNVPVFLDSPLAINVTHTFNKYPEFFNEEIKTIIDKGENPFEFKELTYCYTKEESIQINETKGAKIIIAGSGMCEGGRVKYHLTRYIQDKKNMILFIGYQVGGTLGRKILTGETTIEIEGKLLNIEANVSSIDGFSAHADQKDLIHFIKEIDNIFCINLIHGDQQKLEIFKEKLTEQLQDKVHIVKMNERIYI